MKKKVTFRGAGKEHLSSASRELESPVRQSKQQQKKADEEAERIKKAKLEHLAEQIRLNKAQRVERRRGKNISPRQIR